MKDELTQTERYRLGVVGPCTKPEEWVKAHSVRVLDKGIPRRYIKTVR